MAMAGLYRRMLPSPPAVDFSSTEGKKLFVEAIQHGTMEGFYKLVSFFQTQSEPAFCGLASLSMVLNALAINPGRKWKGPWRWFDESMLDCCEPLEKVKAKGISFGKLVCLAQCAGAKVDAYRTSQSTVEDFRKHVISCSSSDNCHIISSYHRATLKQTGTGHFSPIGGYHAEKDMALILDVARFKYPPHWVPVTLLWEAMDQADESTGQQRGFMLISRPHRDPGLLYTLSCRHESWIGISKYLMDEVPLLLRSEDVKDMKATLSVVFTFLPSNFAEFIKWFAEIRRQEDTERSLSEEERLRLAVKEEVLKQVQGTGLFRHVVEFLSSAISCYGHRPISIHEDNMRKIAENVCCQGAEILTGKSGFSKGYCCGKTCVKCLKINDDKPITVVSGTVVMGDGEQKVDMLLPSAQRKPCCGASQNHHFELHPTGDDILTALLLALPPETWSGIKDKNLVQELNMLMSTESLPTLLQEEVIHLRRQLYLLKRFQENKIDQDFTAPLT